MTKNDNAKWGKNPEMRLQMLDNSQIEYLFENSRRYALIHLTGNPHISHIELVKA